MQKFQKMLEELKGLDLKIGEYAIVGAGPLAVRKLRETEDLDVIVKTPIFERLKKENPNTETKEEFGAIIIGNIDISDSLLKEKKFTNEIIDSAEVIDGFAYAKLDYILRFKNKLGREKDLKDIELINNYLKNKD